MSAHLLHPKVRCPKCQAPPALRIPDAVRQLVARLDPSATVLSYRCRCGEVYILTAKDYQDAA